MVRPPPLYLLIQLLSIAIGLMYLPLQTLMLALIDRAVPDNQRSYALGIQLLIVRLLGFIPSPVLIGVVIDSNCILWSKTACGRQASCLAYQNYQFSVNVAIFCVATSGMYHKMFLTINGF